MLRNYHLTAFAVAALSVGWANSSFADQGSAPQAQETSCPLNQACPVLTEADKAVDIRRISEAFGHLIGRNLDNPGFKFDLESVIKGIRDAAAGKPAPMSDEEYEDAMTRIQDNAFNAIAATNLKQADAFMKDNAKADKVVVIEEGKLQYIILRPGTGPAVEEHATPLIHYKGSYLDGTVFGSSEESEEPIEVPLDQTIPGFSKGLIGMKKGEKRKLFIHPDLGYGTQGHLPPNSLLIFEVEIVETKNPDSTKTAPVSDQATQTPEIGELADNIETSEATAVGGAAEELQALAEAKPAETA